MQPDLAIVIVHWNVAHLLGPCLKSVVADVEHSGLNARICVVDSASPDQSYQEVVASFSDVSLIRMADNRGYAAGCNVGIRSCDSDAVLLLNPDTELMPGTLRTLWDTLHVAPHIGMTAPLLLNGDGTVQSAGYAFPGVVNVVLDLFPVHPRLTESTLNGRVGAEDGVSPVRIDYPLGAAMLIRRSALDDTGFLDETYGMYCEEIDLSQRLARTGWTTLLAPAARVIHYGGQSTGQWPDAMHEALWFSRAAYYERFGSKRQRRMVAAIVQIGLRRLGGNESPGRRAINERIRERFNQIVEHR